MGGCCYALDPHDDEVSFWLFRLGLRAPRFAPLQEVRPTPGPLPSLDVPITVAALDEAWREGVPSSWSAQRVAVAVLDVHKAAMPPGAVMAFVATRSRWSPLRFESAQFWRSGAIQVRVGRHLLRSAHHRVLRTRAFFEWDAATCACELIAGIRVRGGRNARCLHQVDSAHTRAARRLIAVARDRGAKACRRRPT